MRTKNSRGPSKELRMRDLEEVAMGASLPMDYAPIKRDMLMANEVGEIVFANASRFVESNFSEPLTTYAVGWRDPNDILGTLEHVAPAVQVSRRFEFMQATNAEEFLSEVDDVRGIGASFKRIEFTSSKVNAKTLNKGLTMRIDVDNVEDLPNWKTIYTGRILRRLYRNELRRGISLLSAAATNTPYTWDKSIGKDPDADLEALTIAFQDASGVNPTRLLYGAVAWQKRRQSHRAQNTAGGFASAGMSVDEVAQYLGMEAGRVSRERYQSSSTAKSRVVGDIVLMYLAEAGQTQEDPSNIKRFTSPCEGGTYVRVYEQRVNDKMIDITVEHFSNIIVTSTLGIQQGSIS